ncbi:MAG: HEPN domain-containing protein [Cellvibrionaceae bacterium]
MLKTTLTHLPEAKQANIRAIVDIIHDEFDRVTTAATTEQKKNSRIVLAILFGSHAKGTYVDDPKNGYISDYDILVVLNEPELADDYKIWHTVEERATIKTGAPVNLVVCTLREINQELKQGHYFFKDIREQGIQLYQYNHAELLTPGVLNADEAKQVAQKHFDHWYQSANEFFEGFYFHLEKKHFKVAAFELHQTVERYYSCILLVHTNYRPKTHNIKALHSLVCQHADELQAIFPQNKKANRRAFQLLKKAYIEARYSEHYSISEEELNWLAGEVEKLQKAVERLCKEKINSN